MDPLNLKLNVQRVVCTRAAFVVSHIPRDEHFWHTLSHILVTSLTAVCYVGKDSQMTNWLRPMSGKGTLVPSRLMPANCVGKHVKIDERCKSIHGFTHLNARILALSAINVSTPEQDFAGVYC